ncbi:hypothetical protein DFJ58DRAFT_775576 [Suillus subalutaceus]|uniref:uncharacterized protein n=1 Tax=Suillus subalutaceus TaxID=48586 RepID=UPI001B872669|nr:uncharacterized protein DFJ58DRAFT_775576 [Suillus subalutaceus]KAG1862536.1 hypothetical protein DFJ58DRAFT_775576 [Suillus subalutaceus]
MFTTESDVEQILLCTYAVLAGNSILIYDHVMTLPEEIALIWRRPKALFAMLFLLNRYLALFGITCSMVMQPFLVSDEESSYVVSRSLPREVHMLKSSVIMAMRIYALYGCSQRVLAWMTITIIALVGIACAVTFAQVSGDAAILPGIGCYEVYPTETYVILFATLRIGLAWVALFVFDLLIFVLTVYKICMTRGLPRLSLTTRRNVIDVMFQDGKSFVCLAMALINIPNILTYYVAIRGSLCNFTSCLSVTLISRLVLNLHETTDTGILSTTVRGDDYHLDVLTTRVDVQSAISSHYW